MSHCVEVSAFVPVLTRGTLALPESYAWEDVTRWTLIGRRASFVMLDGTVHECLISLGLEPIPDIEGHEVLMLDAPLTAAMVGQGEASVLASRPGGPPLTMCHGVGPAIVDAEPIDSDRRIDGQPEVVDLEGYERAVHAHVGAGIARSTFVPGAEYAGLCATQETRYVEHIREGFDRRPVWDPHTIARHVLCQLPAGWVPFGPEATLIDAPWDEDRVASALRDFTMGEGTARWYIDLVREELRYSALPRDLGLKDLAWVIRQRLARLPRFIALTARVLAYEPGLSREDSVHVVQSFVREPEHVETVMEAYRGWSHATLAEAVSQAIIAKASVALATEDDPRPATVCRPVEAETS